MDIETVVPTRAELIMWLTLRGITALVTPRHSIILIGADKYKCILWQAEAPFSPTELRLDSISTFRYGKPIPWGAIKDECLRQAQQIIERNW